MKTRTSQKSSARRSRRILINKIRAGSRNLNHSDDLQVEVPARESIPEDRLCMIEGCARAGEEVIALLDERPDNDFAATGNPSASSENEKIIPAIVCRRHYDKLMSSWYPIADNNLKRSVTE